MSAGDIRAWCWPVQAFDSRKPVISDGFDPNSRGGKGHWGVDIDFKCPVKRHASLPDVDSSGWFECPSGRVNVVAPAECRVVKVGVITTGHRVQLDMGSPPGGMPGPTYVFITHMKSINGDIVVGKLLQMGAPIGIVGPDPRQGAQGFNHCHFEIWDMERSGPYPGQSVNPEPFMKNWGYKDAGGTIQWPDGVYDGQVADGSPDIQPSTVASGNSLDAVAADFDTGRLVT